MFSLNWFLIFIFLSMNHPLSLGFILLTQTILMSLYSSLLYYNSWFSYILFLVMISGLMIMFIYMTSIASNEKFKMPKIKMNFSLIIFSMMLIMSTLIDYFFSSPPMLMIMTNQINLLNLMNSPLTKFFNNPHLFMMLFLMNYLLLTLIIVVKITTLNSGPLRQK
uniref:NADH-ubiquinone oxidoreductase chain 6 n=1 Tax=Hylastes brunneus TaxID=1117389 RepID=A0A343A6G8_9CUCU|nr:NADH dehydrogenase subunit 6 [Hylastes brunneus]AOY40147.1 NADH dehydrogenase subunit 6 [Hylastes brunneus]